MAAHADLGRAPRHGYDSHAEGLKFAVGRLVAFPPKKDRDESSPLRNHPSVTPGMRREARWLASRMLPVALGVPCDARNVALVADVLAHDAAQDGVYRPWHRQLIACFERWLGEVRLSLDPAVHALFAGGVAAVDDIARLLSTYLLDAPDVVLRPPEEVRVALGQRLAEVIPTLWERERPKRPMMLIRGPSGRLLRLSTSGRPQRLILAGERLARLWTEAVGLHWPDEPNRTLKTARRIGRSVDALVGSHDDLIAIGRDAPNARASLASLANEHGEPSDELDELCKALVAAVAPCGTAVPPTPLSLAAEDALAPLLVAGFGSSGLIQRVPAMLDGALRATFGLEPWQVRWWALFEAHSDVLAAQSGVPQLVTHVRELAPTILDPSEQLGKLVALENGDRVVDALRRYKVALKRPGGAAISPFGLASRWAGACRLPIPPRKPRPTSPAKPV